MAHIVIFLHEFLPRSSMVVILFERSILLVLPTFATHIAIGKVTRLTY